MFGEVAMKGKLVTILISTLIVSMIFLYVDYSKLSKTNERFIVELAETKEYIDVRLSKIENSLLQKKSIDQHVIVDNIEIKDNTELPEEEYADDNAASVLEVDDVKKDSNASIVSSILDEYTVLDGDRLVVATTPEQSLAFQSLNSQLDNSHYISSISLGEFTGSEELMLLPKPMQLLILNRAVRLQREGYFSSNLTNH